VEFPQKNRSILIYAIISVPTVASLMGMLFSGLNMDDFMA
jgi:hypothetical protein